jgi:hypothetical protein
LKTGIVVLLLFFAVRAGGQEKVEIEQRIQVGDVPLPALEWLKDAYENARKTKWYYEETTGLKSYEAKLKWKGHMHSVEFDTSGVIQDIEISVEWEELPAMVQENIMAYLDSAFTRYRVQKIQEQWTGAPDDLEDLIDEREMEDLTTRYEIYYYGKKASADEIWEGLFDADGKILQERIVKLRPTDNLNF